jgi:bifunctional enzyme CysN/CysC
MKQTTVKSIDFFGEANMESASTPQSVSITLSDEIDISRGDMIIRVGNIPRMQSKFEAMVVWMGEVGLNLSTPYIIMHTSRTTKAYVEKVRYRIDVNTLSRLPSALLQMNEIGRLSLTVSQPLFLDNYDRNRACGSFIIVDPETYLTVAAGMVIDPKSVESELVISTAENQSNNLHFEIGNVSREQRELKLGHRAISVWFTGLSGSGKSTIAKELEKRLFDKNIPVYNLDGDNLRTGLNSDLRFGDRDRCENIRRVAHVAKLMNEAGITVICSFISPYEKDRQLARTIVGEKNFLEVYLSTPLEKCEERDPHGLYRKARDGEIKDFTGINSPYEVPIIPDLSIRTDKLTVTEALLLIEDAFKRSNRL